jgi:hypothetical protein
MQSRSIRRLKHHKQRHDVQRYIVLRFCCVESSIKPKRRENDPPDGPFWFLADIPTALVRVRDKADMARAMRNVHL